MAEPLRVAIDAGHGGRDIGASRGGVEEAALMLVIARELAAAMARQEGLVPVLIRDDDSFVPLSERVARARAAQADVLISLHADALLRDEASGASVYTLSPSGGDAASSRMVERHGRDQLLPGVDLRGQDDALATVLLDLARGQSGAASDALAEALVEGFARTGARLNARPRREAALAVLGAAEMPSVLVELGFLSNAQDLAALQTAKGRAPLVAGIVLGVKGWAAQRAAERAAGARP